MKAIIVKLKCLTNMHVGNGDVNYNIVDNEVELDPVTGYPTINASGVKGALRAHFSKGNTEKKIEEKTILDWFGSDAKERKDHKQGKLQVLGANMIARPLRSTKGRDPYYLVYTEKMKEQYVSMCKAFGITEKDEPKEAGAVAEAEGVALKDPRKIEGETVYKIDDLRDYALPVLARNYLENGISKNLWYEEVVPHESCFYFFITSEDDNCLKEVSKAINDAGVIQFGGNASIGYGLCRVSARGLENEQKKS